MGYVKSASRVSGIDNLLKGAITLKVAYIRVSSIQQKIDRQEIIIERLGVERVYVEKASGKNTDRPVLNEMMAFLREGDELVVESISRFARNTRDLLSLIEQLRGRGVKFVSVKENIDTSTPAGEFMLTIMGAQAQLERQYMLERQKEGIEAAKLKGGVYKGRNKIVPDAKGFEMVYRQWKAGQIKAVEAMKLLQLKPNTFYRRVKEYEGQQVIDF